MSSNPTAPFNELNLIMPVERGASTPVRILVVDDEPEIAQSLSELPFQARRLSSNHRR